MNTYYFAKSEVKHLLDTAQDQRCFNCRRPFDFSENQIVGYKHDNGHVVGRVKFWLNVNCRCGHQTSFTKLGICKTGDQQ